MHTMRDVVCNVLLLLQFQGSRVSQESENLPSNNEVNQCAKHAHTHVAHLSVNQARRDEDRCFCKHSHSLIGEVKGPAPPMVLAMTRSAICLRARRPEGLLPFVSWSWIRPSSSSLNTCKKKKTQGDRKNTVVNLCHPDDRTTTTLTSFQYLQRMCPGSTALLITTVHRSLKESVFVRLWKGGFIKSKDGQRGVYIKPDYQFLHQE